MLIYSMSVSVDGLIADRGGAFGWSVPSEELFLFHIALVSELGSYLCGRKLGLRVDLGPHDRLAVRHS